MKKPTLVSFSKGGMALTPPLAKGAGGFEADTFLLFSAEYSA
ncbi:MAG: hypothetical protein QG641_197 [Candidatus Poribacteria bacterium]|nr:hypothetical protein [Candidatus Poribacteria bacterium]